MTYIAKPKVHHPSLKPNAIGLTRRDYEGAITTLCAGCGHDSITAAIIQAFWELSIAPHKVAKLSGANAANGDLIMIGVSGDGDSLSIGLGQLCHAIRRNVNMLYVLENNGVYGLTKGQFSASADKGSTAKKGEANAMEPIDGVLMALTLGATFVARSFSGDKDQLVPIIKAGLAHKGFAFIDVISPCVTFNDHEGSTKSYAHTREHKVEVVHADFVPLRDPIETSYAEGSVQTVTLHDGSIVKLHKVDQDYDATNRDAAYSAIRDHQRKGEVMTGLLYISTDSRDVHDQNETISTPLYSLPHDQLCPGNDALQKLMAQFR
jgi:2-oxoglutarate ferredoxin oxidoreductase subunit beta